MVLTFYMDVWPGQLPAGNLSAHTSPGIKPAAGARRIAFDVVIPDSLLLGVDYHSPAYIEAKDAAPAQDPPTV